MTPEQARQIEMRIQRWRSFKDVVSHPLVDWSPRANRRRGWAGTLAARNPHTSGLTPAVPAIGPPDTIRVAFLRIDFLHDRGGDASTGDGHFDLSGPNPDVPAIDRPPHNRSFYLDHLEALRRYYDAQTFGRVVVVGDVWPHEENGAYSCTDMGDFGPWVFGTDAYPPAVHMFRTMFFAADSQATLRGDPIPWDTYDRFMVIHAGGDLQDDLHQDSPEDIPSFTVGLGDTDVVIFPDSTNRPIDRCSFVPETLNQDGFYGGINGVIAHENGHNFFGFVDLYNISTGLPVVGYWSLMDSGNLIGKLVDVPGGSQVFAVGLMPPSIDPFHRFLASDAVNYREVIYGDTAQITEIERHPDIRRVSLSSDEYLLLENRYKLPGTLVFDQDSATTVILGPKLPDPYEYDALTPGPGVLVWHIDASVVPFETALRPDYGVNTIPGRPGVSIIEADGLADLGDPGSPLLLGSPYDPFFRINKAVLADDTEPNLRPFIGAYPHVRLGFLDDSLATMRVTTERAWQRPGWPIAVNFPLAGPLPLAVDADGDRDLEVCWAGGNDGGGDSTALFAVRANGQGLFGTTPTFASLDYRPLPLMAALPLGQVQPGDVAPQGPAYFAVTTHAYTDTNNVTVGGKVWLLDQYGQSVPGWPKLLPGGIATTPPAIAGTYPNAWVFVGCADGCVYQLNLDGSERAHSASLGRPVSGWLAVDAVPLGGAGPWVAAGDAGGHVAVFDFGPIAASTISGWPQTLGTTGFTPDFLWIDFDGGGHPASGTPTCAGGARALIVHQADHLWAFCPGGEALPGWGRFTGDTLVAGLGAGDPDGDGYAEVLTQSTQSRVAFWNQSGGPSPGWPKPGSRETQLRTTSPPIAVDVTGDGHAEVVTLNASGILAAMNVDGREPPGWPLATGSGAGGSLLAADLDRDGAMEIIAPDRELPDSLQFSINGRFGTLYAYTVPPSPSAPTVRPWTMVGGDPGRSFTLPVDRAPSPGPSASGPLVHGSLKAYPNPARRRPVSFAYQLSEPAEVDFRILDVSGHEVAAFTRPGRRADNLELWDPGATPSGLYVAHLRFRGATSEEAEVVTVGLLR